MIGRLAVLVLYSLCDLLLYVFIVFCFVYFSYLGFIVSFFWVFFFFQAEDGIRDHCVTGVQTCALPIWMWAMDGTMAPSSPRSRHACARAWSLRSGMKQAEEEGRGKLGGSRRTSCFSRILLCSCCSSSTDRKSVV